MEIGRTKAYLRLRTRIARSYFRALLRENAKVRLSVWALDKFDHVCDQDDLGDKNSSRQQGRERCHRPGEVTGAMD